MRVKLCPDCGFTTRLELSACPKCTAGQLEEVELPPATRKASH